MQRHQQRSDPMEITLTINKELTHALCDLASRCGISVEDMGYQALVTGMMNLQSYYSAPEKKPLIPLGKLNTTLPTAKQVNHMQSPILMIGATPPPTPPSTTKIYTPACATTEAERRHLDTQDDMLVPFGKLPHPETMHAIRIGTHLVENAPQHCVKVADNAD